MSRKLHKMLYLLAIVTGTALTACGGCDDTAAGAGAPDGTACERDSDCAGECGDAGFCVGGNNGTANNGTANNGSGSNNGTGTNNNGTTTTNNGTGTGLPEGSMCMSDAECAGYCSSTGVCIGGGSPDGTACQMDTECAGFCDNGTCAGAGTGEPFPTNPDGQVLCGDTPCACDDGIDGDGDGLIDGFDPECTGPYDNDEETFATGIPGDNKDPKWQDCFFDGNSGAGDDGCRYHTDCLYGLRDMNDPDCAVSQECFDYCRPLTPNGCDCFGCCAVATDGGTVWVGIGGGCTDVNDVDNCEQCTPTDACLNECGRCELCAGKTVDDLPADCSQGDGFDGDPCTADADCRGICGGSNTCEGYGDGGGFAGDPCMTDADCRGECGQDSNFCEGFGTGEPGTGSGTGFDGDACKTDADCRGTCGGDGVCTGDGAGGYVGDACTADTDCRGTCGGSNTCEGYGSGGYNGDSCQSDADCRGVCGGNNTCEDSGSGSGSGVQCENGEQACPEGQCPSQYYCQQGCCIFIPG